MSNLIKIIKYSVKIKLNFFKDIMNKLCETFQSPYKRSQASILFHTTFLPLSEFFEPCDCDQISENIFFYLNLLMQKIFFDKIHWFQLLSTKKDWIILLFLISITVHSLSVSHSIMSSFCWQKTISEFQWKICC